MGCTYTLPPTCLQARVDEAGQSLSVVVKEIDTLLTKRYIIVIVIVVIVIVVIVIVVIVIVIVIIFDVFQ